MPVVTQQFEGKGNPVDVLSAMLTCFCAIYAEHAPDFHTYSPQLCYCCLISVPP